MFRANIFRLLNIEGLVRWRQEWNRPDLARLWFHNLQRVSWAARESAHADLIMTQAQPLRFG
jgi:hypothetical protein